MFELSAQTPMPGGEGRAAPEAEGDPVPQDPPVKRSSSPGPERQGQVAAGARTVLIVASAPWSELETVEQVLRSGVIENALLTYLVEPHHELPSRSPDGAAPEAVPCRRGIWGVARAALGLRRRRFHLTILPFTGKPGYLWLKLCGFLAGFPRILIINENRDYFVLAASPLFHHARWRLREALARWGHLARAAWDLGRSQGLGAVVRRSWERRRHARPRLPRLRLLLRSHLQPRVSLHAEVESPQVSIVIPVHNNHSFTANCLASLARHTGSGVEMILVDGASSDSTQSIERRVSGLRVVRLTDNPGFVTACNVGASLARGEFVLFLNNDTVVTPGWLDALLDVFSRDPSCGAVGAKLLYPNGILQEAGGIVWRDGTCWNYGRMEDATAAEFNYLRRVDYCSGAALMVRLADFRRLGGFDARYVPGYSEDVDLCFALRALGRSVWYQPRSEVFHFEGATSGVDTGQGMKRFQVINSRKFCDKWASELVSQVPFDRSALFQARDRNHSAVVLVFDHYVPTPDRDAGSAFMSRLLETLAAHGLRVLLWPDNRFRTPGYTEALEGQGIEVLYGTLPFPAWLAAHGHWIDHAIAHRSPIAEKYLPELAKLDCTRSYIAADLEYVRETRRATFEHVPESTLEQLRSREAALARAVDCVGVHSPVEQRILRSELGAARVVHLPLPVSAKRSSASVGFDARRDLLFMGGTHPPNVDALRHFVDVTFPRLRAELGDVKLWVIGDVGLAQGGPRATEGVERVGAVADLGEWFDRCRVFVAPLRYGAGIKGKVLEALNNGLPVVTTVVGAEGIGLDHRRSAMIAANDDEFLAHTVELYSDPKLWQSLREAGFLLVEREFGQLRFQRGVLDFMAALEGSRKDRRRRDRVALGTAERAAPP